MKLALPDPWFSRGKSEVGSSTLRYEIQYGHLQHCLFLSMAFGGSWAVCLMESSRCLACFFVSFDVVRSIKCARLWEEIFSRNAPRPLLLFKSLAAVFSLLTSRCWHRALLPSFVEYSYCLTRIYINWMLCDVWKPMLDYVVRLENDFESLRT